VIAATSVAYRPSYVFRLWQKSVREVTEYQKAIKQQAVLEDTATGNKCRPTLARQYAGTCSWYDEDERKR